MSVRQPRPFRKGGALINTTEKVRSRIMLVIEQHLNLTFIIITTIIISIIIVIIFFLLLILLFLLLFVLLL